jgi:aerobic-type carbon monoxide dehydrogenase small subunit (CoxS/CutS family)
VSEMGTIHLNVNGQAVEAQVDPEMSLLVFLREELGLTGAKDGCSEGTCGACTVIVDGEARRSCLLKMKRMERGRFVVENGVFVGCPGDGMFIPRQRFALKNTN